MRVVSYGGGVNSTALLIGMQAKGEVPNRILFADTGGEKGSTYAYVELFSKWLERHNMPPVTTIGNETSPHKSLEEECLTNKTLPSLAFGFRGCSVKWKRQPMDRYIRSLRGAHAEWAAGRKVERVLGIDADEAHRGLIEPCKRFWYSRPLVDWDWGREECEAAIRDAGLPVPDKSACWFCPAMKKQEVIRLAETRCDLFQRAVKMERNAAETLSQVRGLGRNWSWETLVAADRAQLRLFPEAPEEPCLCHD